MRHAWATVGVVALASFQVSMTLSVVFVVFVDLEDYFPAASNAELSWAINSFTIVTASTVVLGSAIADRYGRKRLTLIGTLLFAVGSIIAGVAPGVGVLIAGRCIQAIGLASYGPASIALVLEAFPFEKRGLAMGVITMGGGLAAGAGPALGGWIVDTYTWRWAFLAVVPVGLSSLVAGWVVFEESRGEREKRLPDALGSVMLMAGVGSLILALVQSDGWGWGDRRTVAAIVFGVGLLAVLLRRSAQHAYPIVDLEMYRFRSFRAGNAGIAVFAMSFFTMQFAAILFLTDIWGYELDRAGLLAAPFFLTTGLMGPIAGRIVDVVGPRPVVSSGAALWAASILVLWQLIGDEPNLTMWLIVVLVAGTGSGFFWGAAPTLAVEGLDGRRFARASGVNQTLQNIGNALAIALAITLLGDEPSRGDFSPVFALIFAAGVAASAIGWSAGPRVAPTPVVLGREPEATTA